VNATPTEQGKKLADAPIRTRARFLNDRASRGSDPASRGVSGQSNVTACREL
jgi:hypothetical protein